MKRVCFFLDDIREYGLGHLSRCTAVMQGLIEIDFTCEVRMVGNFDSAPSVSFPPGVSFHYSDTRNAYESDLPEILFIDRYSLTNLELELLDSFGKDLYFFDDLSVLEYKKGVVINAAIDQDSMDPQHSATLLNGYEYICLREPFWDISPSHLRQPMQHVLLAMGSMDVRKIIPDLIRLCVVVFRQCTVHVLATSAMPHLHEMISGQKSNVIFYVDMQAEELALLYPTIDLAITAGGQTSLEVLRYAIPCAVISIAENQRQSVDLLGRNNLAYVMDEDQTRWIDSIQLFSDFAFRKSMHDRCLSVMDGQGARRIARHINQSLETQKN